MPLFARFSVHNSPLMVAAAIARESDPYDHFEKAKCPLSFILAFCAFLAWFSSEGDPCLDIPISQLRGEKLWSAADLDSLEGECCVGRIRAFRAAAADGLGR